MGSKKDIKSNDIVQSTIIHIVDKKTTSKNDRIKEKKNIIEMNVKYTEYCSCIHLRDLTL